VAAPPEPYRANLLGRQMLSPVTAATGEIVGLIAFLRRA